ncbi:MAG: histidine kinase [Saprospiraceae bacterium]|nr:histidine kinase [Saprospiraceae bacterium]MCB0542007.1 histidine kinase [Saprospiraceae bacterium]MCB0574104.1 histidine kinase [Saprospiraceae bacterium]MCB9305210.1 histidine kinase [Lewinellaceae bacterium]MCB9354355.1 histidine kinase [Lewinellaceae bacterium]
MPNKCFREVAGFDDRLLVIIGVPLASVLVSLLLFSDMLEAGNWGYFMVCIPMSLVYTSCFWLGMRWAYYRARYRYPAFRDIRKRLFWLLLAFLALFLAINTVLDAIFGLLMPEHQEKPGQISDFIVSLVVSALVITIYEALSFYLQLEREVAEKAELKRQNVESQLEGLRNQVNPHFLFNSLNTLIYLIPEDSEKAVHFVQQLSKVYRYVLESRDTKMIPLSEELEFLKAYIFLLHERFGNNLQVDIRRLEQKQNAAIVPLTLQLLFENAIKHNVISTDKPLRIEVFSENGHLVVRNNLQRKNQVMDSTGVGLQNIKDRYRLLTDRVVEVITSQQYFTVALPMVELPRL